MNGIVLTASYLGNIQFYSKLNHYTNVVVEQHCHYAKQTYRNRCNIATANGVMPLSIPIIKSNKEKCKTKDIRIDNTQHWQQIHWRAFESGYNSSPFFEYYKDDLEHFYTNKYTFLIDFNMDLQNTILHLLGIEKQIQLTDSYSGFPENYCDFREKISTKKIIEDKDFVQCKYYQVFQEKFGFIPNLSIVDLLFNMGNESILILNQSYSN